jgi:tetratricopeptide (TPR) repeat protein
MRRLSEVDNGNAGFQRDLSVARNRIGAALLAQGDLQGAIDEHRASLAIVERLTATNPNNIEFQRDLAWCNARIAELLRAQGRVADALASERVALAITKRPETR